MPLKPTRVQAVFLDAASHHDLAARTAILDRACMGDPELRQRVEALLKAHDRFNDFVNQPLGIPGGWTAWHHADSDTRQ
jgi:eukaryotic-like serine/threonine-protein kinase